MIKKILVAFDGSEQSRRAYALALDMAAKYSASVFVVSVARPPEPPVDVEMKAVLESATEHYQERFTVMKKEAAAAGIEAAFGVRAGHPAEQIILAADEEDIDAIVMGHRGGSVLQRWLLGSVAKRVLAYAHCTVIIVR